MYKSIINNRSTKKLIAISVLSTFIAACISPENSQEVTNANNDGLNNQTTESSVITGRVGGGPNIGAAIAIRDAGRKVVTETTSDTQAKYDANLPNDVTFPIIVTASGGTDLVSGMEPGFTMVSGIDDKKASTVNVNLFTTLITKTASAMPGGLSADNVAIATDYVLQQLNFGLDTNLLPDPIRSEITDANIANVAKSSKALAEMIRRVSNALSLAGVVMNTDQVIDALAVDLADGALDGQGAGADVRVAATATIVSAQVVLEALNNHLQVNGGDATSQLDAAIAMVEPMSTLRSADVGFTNEMLDQARKAVAATYALTANDTLSEIAAALDGISSNSSPGDVKAALSQDVGAVYDEAITRIAYASEADLKVVIAAALPGGIPVSTPVPTSVPKPGPTPVSTPVPTSVPKPVPTPVSTPVPTSVPKPAPTPVSTPVPTSVPKPVPTPVSTPVPTSVPKPVPTPVSTPVPTSVPKPVPTPVSTPVPTSVPKPVPTPVPNLISAGAFEFGAATYEAAESAGAVNVTIRRVGSSSGVASVEWRTRTFDGYGTADWAKDYVTVYPWLAVTFADGETSKVVSVKIADDNLVEGNETFSVMLQNPTNGATLAATTKALVTIRDNDIAATPRPTPTPVPTSTPTPAPTATPMPTPIPASGARPWENLLSSPDLVGFGRNTTGGKGGEVCWVNNLNNSGAGSLRSCAESVGRKWIRFNVSGTLNLSSEINVKSDKTIDGRGQNITLTNYGLRLSYVSNIIIHNIAIRNVASTASGATGDALHVARSVNNVWIDHVTLSGAPDELLDIGKEATDITVSWSRFEKNGKAVLISWGPTEVKDVVIRVTMHNNFFDSIAERAPNKLRFGKAHVFNNYVYNWTYRGAQVSQDGEICSQNNVYEKLSTGGQDTAIYTHNDSVENPGNANSEGDLLMGRATIIERNADQVFDPKSYYSYTLKPAGAALKSEIMAKAGRQNIAAP